MKKEELINKEFNESFNINVRIIELDDDIPDSEYEEFVEWLIYKASEVGTGRHKEYFYYGDGGKDDYIGVLFYASSNTNSVLYYIDKLTEQSFEGWNDDEIKGYLTACETIKKSCIC